VASGSGVAMGRAIGASGRSSHGRALSNLDAKMRVQTRTDVAKLQRDSASPPSTSPTTRPRQ